MSIKNLRSHKIFGLAIFDLSISFIFTIALFMIAWRIHFKQLDWWKFFITALILTIPIGITFHILFPTISIALAWVLLFFKLRFNKTGDQKWMEAYRLWVKFFAYNLKIFHRRAKLEKDGVAAPFRRQAVRSGAIFF